MDRIKEINILGKRFSIDYVDKPSDVDIFKRQSLWGQIDFWTSSIRIYVGNRTDDEIWETVLHEIIHDLIQELKIKALINADGTQNEETVCLLAMGLYDTLYRNKMFNGT